MAGNTIKMKDLPVAESSKVTDLIGLDTQGQSVKLPNKQNELETEVASLGSDVDGLSKKTENISTESVTAEEDAIVFETDGGVQVGKIDNNGADFVNLKKNGDEIATKTEVNKKQDTLIAGKNITIGADGKTISAEGGVGDLPITKESETSEEDAIVFETDNGTQVGKIDSNGADFKNLSKDGKSVLTTEDKLVEGEGIHIEGNVISATGGVGDLPISKETTAEEVDLIEFCDEQGKPVMKITPDKVMVSKITDIDGNPIGKDEVFAKYDMADINHFFVIGQSLALGQAGTYASYNNFRNSLMFDYGGTISVTPVDSEMLGGLKNSTRIGSECPVLSMSEEFYNLLEEENKIEDFDDYGFSSLITTYGFGGRSVTVFLDQIDDIKTIILTAYENAVKLGKTYSVAGIGYVQGEADRNANDEKAIIYHDRVHSLFSQINEYVKSLTGQKEDVQFVMYQTSSWATYSNADRVQRIGLMQDKLSKEYDNYCLGSATYQFEYQESDNVHMVTNSYRLLGASLGTALKRRIVDHKRVNSISVMSTRIFSCENKYVIELKMYAPCYPLVFDNTSPVNGQPLKFYDKESGEEVVIPYQGFELMNSDHTTYLNSVSQYAEQNWHSVDIIESVSIKRGDTINIVCNSNPNGLELWYARRGNQGGGYLRDSQGDSVKISSSSTDTIRVDNWCPIFTIKL